MLFQIERENLRLVLYPAFFHGADYDHLGLWGGIVDKGKCLSVALCSVTLNRSGTSLEWLPINRGDFLWCERHPAETGYLNRDLLFGAPYDRSFK